MTGWRWALGVLLIGGCAAESAPTPVSVVASGLRHNLAGGGLFLRATDADGGAYQLGPEQTTVTVHERLADGTVREIDDVEIRWDGPSGIDVALVADNSGSEAEHIDEMQSAIRAFADTIYGFGTDSRAGLVRVSTNVRVIQDLTPIAIQFDAAVDRLYVANGWTALWDGIRMGNETLERGIVVRNAQEPNTCVDAALRAVVAFTDGRDNNSADEHVTSYPGDGIDTTPDDLRDLEVFRGETPVFVLGIGDQVDEATLTGIATDTHGQYRNVAAYHALQQQMLVLSEQVSASIPICFDTSEDAVEVVVEITIDGELFTQTLPVPQDRCTAPDPTYVSDYQPLHALVPCSDELLGSLSSPEEVVSVADLGCDPGGGATPLYQQALQPGSLYQYQPPTAAEAATLDAILPGFYADLRTLDADLAVYRADLASAGLALHEYTVGAQRWVVVFDDSPAWRGTGGYVFRRGPATEIVIQAPHSFFDLRTADLAGQLMSAGNFRGFFFSTVHRHYLLPGATCSNQVDPADVAHVTNSFFYKLTTHYLTDVPMGTIIQLHGMDNAELAAQGIGAVLSSGGEPPSEQVIALDAALGDTLAGETVGVYPVDVDLYGATLNIQGRWVRSTDRGHFLHVEMSPTMRASLLVDPVERQRFADALLAAAPM